MKRLILIASALLVGCGDQLAEQRPAPSVEVDSQQEELSPIIWQELRAGDSVEQVLEHYPDAVGRELEDREQYVYLVRQEGYEIGNSVFSAAMWFTEDGLESVGLSLRQTDDWDLVCTNLRHALEETFGPAVELDEITQHNPAKHQGGLFVSDGQNARLRCFDTLDDYFVSIHYSANTMLGSHGLR